MNDRNERVAAILPFTELELRKYYHILTKAGYDPERLARVKPSQIVYSHSWVPPTRAAANSATDIAKSIAINNNDASIITAVHFSVVEPEFAVEIVDEDTGTTQNAQRVWKRADDAKIFSTARNPLDYISMQVSSSASEQLSTGHVPLSHWTRRQEGGWMPSPVDFIPGGNYSSYELALRCDRHLYFKRLDISLTAIQLIGL